MGSLLAIVLPLAAGCALVLAGFSVLALLLAQSTRGTASPDEAGAILLDDHPLLPCDACDRDR
jgi:hypothetical protein